MQVRHACTRCGLEKWMSPELAKIVVCHLGCGGAFVKVLEVATEFVGAAGAIVKIKPNCY